MRVKIVTDSACDIAISEATSLGISMVPLKIRFGETELVDQIEISHEEFAKKLVESKELPSTAAPSPGEFAEAFSRAFSEGFEAVLCITISSGLSATMQSAQSGAALVKTESAVQRDIRFIDTRQASAGEAVVVRAAIEAAKTGADINEVEKAAKSACERITTLGTLNTLEYLKRGGRIGKASAFFGTILSIKPIILFEDGVVKPLARQRTRSQAVAFLADYAEKQGDVERIIVGFILVEESERKKVIDSYREKFPNAEILTSEIGPVTGTHGGPGTIAVSFLRSA